MMPTLPHNAGIVTSGLERTDGVLRTARLMRIEFAAEDGTDVDGHLKDGTHPLTSAACGVPSRVLGLIP
jgi:hypothetical protein